MSGRSAGYTQVAVLEGPYSCRTHGPCLYNLIYIDLFAKPYARKRRAPLSSLQSQPHHCRSRYFRRHSVCFTLTAGATGVRQLSQGEEAAPWNKAAGTALCKLALHACREPSARAPCSSLTRSKRKSCHASRLYCPSKGLLVAAVLLRQLQVPQHAQQGARIPLLHATAVAKASAGGAV